MSIESIGVIVFLAFLLIVLIFRQQKNPAKGRKGSQHSSKGSSSYYSDSQHGNRGDVPEEHGRMGGGETGRNHDHDSDSSNGGDDGGSSDGGGGDGGGDGGGGE